MLAASQAVYVGRAASYPCSTRSRTGTARTGRTWSAWEHALLDQLHISPEKHAVLLTEQKITYVMFERFSVPALFVSVSAVLALYALGAPRAPSSTAATASSHSVAVHEGSLAHSALRLDLAGRDCTDLLVARIEGTVRLRLRHCLRHPSPGPVDVSNSSYIGEFLSLDQ